MAEKLLGKIGDFLQSRTPWYKLPRLLAMPRLVEIRNQLRRGDDLDLIDVREPHEWEIARIHGAQLIPLAGLADAAATLDSSRDIVIHCKGGGRSAAAVEALTKAGYRAVNVAGGTMAWLDAGHEVNEGSEP